MQRLHARARDAYDKAIRRKACDIAVENGEMSENEAWRWLKLDRKDQLRSELGPTAEYLKRAEKQLRQEWKEEHR